MVAVRVTMMMMKLSCCLTRPPMKSQQRAGELIVDRLAARNLFSGADRCSLRIRRLLPQAFNHHCARPPEAARAVTAPRGRPLIKPVGRPAATAKIPSDREEQEER
jgi:hypothetical protein